VKKKQIKFLKKLAGSVQFYKPKTEPKPEKKPNQTRLNRFHFGFFNRFGFF
jgi:hypothetical protein